MKIFSEAEIAQFRKETRGTTERIHFNNAGSSLPTDAVVDTVIRYLQEEAVYGGYEIEAKYQKQLDAVYPLIAELINARPDEIAVVENASMGWGIAFNGIGLQQGDVVITSEFEYVTNLLGLLKLQKTIGIEIKVIPNDADGNFSLAALEAAISAKTRLIAITQIPSTAGGILPVVEIGKIARKHDILYLVDACQAVGHVPVDVREMGCDMLCVTGRKYMRGPRGTGFLYVRKEAQDRLTPIFIDGASIRTVSQQGYTLRGDARRFELYENSRALKLGLGTAVQYILAIGMDGIWQRVQKLADLMRRELAAIDGVTIHDIGDTKTGIVTFSVKGVDSNAVKKKLAENRINVSVGLARSTLFYMDKYGIDSLVRASVHYYNTEEEVGMLRDTLKAF